VKRQTRQVLDLLRLRGGDGVTPAEAREALACDRLAARVRELREVGYDIETRRERSPIGATFARYVICETPTAPTPFAGVQPELFR
jgi:hypothetical protein